MKTLRILLLLVIAALILSACGEAQPEQTSAPAEPTATDTSIPPSPTTADTPLPPSPTPFTTMGWTTTASTYTELSFGFPGQWDGPSPLTFGEGSFAKDPDQPLGITFQIELAGDPAALLEVWGTEDVGIVGIATFTPETVVDGPEVTIARLDLPTKIAQGDGITAQVAYIQRPDDVMEVTWFAPTEQWEALQRVFQGILENIELWRKYSDYTVGLQSMYVHDWLDPQAPGEETGLWFRSADESTGLLVFIVDEIADPVQKLEAWSVDRLAMLDFEACTIGEGDRMDTMSGQWESKMGECTTADGNAVTYEVTFAPDRDRLIEIIAYAPTAAWDDANDVAFEHLLGLMNDIRPK